MAGTFKARIDDLQELVGQGKLVMRVNVHQPYAAAEHQRFYYRHPRGGMPDYLQTPFEVQHGEMLDLLAEGFPEIIPAAIDAVGKFEEWVQTYAPVHFDVLRNSCNLYVEDDGSTLYDKPQDAPYEQWKE